MQQALSLAEVAKLLQVAPSTVYGLIREKDDDKRIPFVRVGKSYRFFPVELARFFNLDVSIIEQFIASNPTTKGIKNV